MDDAEQQAPVTYGTTDPWDTAHARDHWQARRAREEPAEPCAAMNAAAVAAFRVAFGRDHYTLLRALAIGYANRWSLSPAFCASGACADAGRQLRHAGLVGPPASVPVDIADVFTRAELDWGTQVDYGGGLRPLTGAALTAALDSLLP